MRKSTLRESTTLNDAKPTTQQQNFRFDIQVYADFKEFCRNYKDKDGQRYTMRAMLQKLMIDFMKKNKQREEQ